MFENSDNENDFYKKDIEFIKKRNREKVKRFRKKKLEALNNKDSDTAINHKAKRAYIVEANNNNSNFCNTDDFPENNCQNSNIEIDESVNLNLSSSSSSSSSTQYLNESSNNEEYSDEELHNVQENKIEDFLYEGSNVKTLDFLYSIQSFKNKHRLSDEATNNLLKLFKIVLPDKNNCPNNLNKFEKSLFNNHNGLYYKLCGSCNKIIETKPLKEFKIEKIKCVTCEAELIPFITFDVIQQLNNILKGSKLDQIKQAYLDSNYHLNKDISKPLHAQLYQDFIKMNEDNKEDLVISFTLNSDGAPLTNSKNFKMWPLMATILELHQSTREKFKNIIFLGVWLHTSKPNYNLFFQESLKQIKSLKDKLVCINGFKIRTRCQALVVDLPAKAAALNIRQFNGEFGCVNCNHPGIFSKIYRKQIYPPRAFEIKTAKDYDDAYKYVEKTNDKVFGIMGTNPFSDVLIIPDQVPFDYMHLVLQGHTKWILNQYIYEKQSDCFIGDKISYLNSIIANIKLPHNINRKFPLIDKTTKLKSAELKLFIFYIALPLLLDVLPNAYWYLLFLYVYGVRTLYEPFNNIEEIKYAEQMIKLYYNLLDEFFGEYAYNYTIHAHLHLPDQVIKHGSLQANSQFVFEGALFNCETQLKGTRGYIHQIFRKVICLKNFETNICKHNFMNSDLNDYCKNLINNVDLNDSMNINKLLNPFVLKIYTGQNLSLVNAYFKSNLANNEFLTANRLIYNNKIFHSIKYKRKGGTNSYTVCFEINKKEFYGDIVEFFFIDNNFFAFIKKFEIMNDLNLIIPNGSGIFSEHVTLTNFQKFYTCLNEDKTSLIIINFKYVICKCMIIKTKKGAFVTKLRYDFEHD